MDLKELRKWIIENKDSPEYHFKIINTKPKRTSNDDVYITLTLKGVVWDRHDNLRNAEGFVGSWIISELFQEYNHIFELVNLEITFKDWRIGFIRSKVPHLFFMVIKMFQEMM